MKMIIPQQELLEFLSAESAPASWCPNSMTNIGVCEHTHGYSWQADAAWKQSSSSLLI